MGFSEVACSGDREDWGRTGSSTVILRDMSTPPSTSSPPPPRSFDWQHVAIVALALLGGAACVLLPDLAKYFGPVLSGVVPLALAKTPPGRGSDVSSSRPEGEGVTVINIGSPPADLTMRDGDVSIKWRNR